MCTHTAQDARAFQTHCCTAPTLPDRRESKHYRVALLPLAARLPLRGSLLLSWEMCRYWNCSPFSRVCPRYSNKPMGAYIYLFFLSLPTSSFYSVSAWWNSDRIRHHPVCHSPHLIFDQSWSLNQSSHRHHMWYLTRIGRVGFEHRQQTEPGSTQKEETTHEILPFSNVAAPRRTERKGQQVPRSQAPSPDVEAELLPREAPRRALREPTVELTPKQLSIELLR